MRKLFKNEIGITLVVLVVTIIILLILAGVSIATLTESGLFEKARQAEQKSQNSQVKEEITLADYENKIGQYVDGTREQIMVDKEEYTQLLSRVEALEAKNDSIEGVGEYYISQFSNVAATASTSNSVASMTLPAGKYVLQGYAHYRGTDLRYHMSLGGANSSAYDNDGYVAMNITNIVDISQETTYTLYIWPSKSVTLSGGYIKAIKIGN